MKSTGTMKGAEARGGGGEAERGRGSDVAYRQELAHLTHDHTHARMHTHRYVGIHINMFYNVFKFFTSLPHTL